MFAKKRPAEERNPTATAAAPKEKNADKPSPKGKTGTPALLSRDVVIEGDMNSTGDIQIDGTMKGNLKAGSVTIGREAMIEGDVEAEAIVVHGRLVGNIKARDVRIRHTAHVEGNITQEALVIEPGAFFDGTCRQTANPFDEYTPKISPVDTGLLEELPAIANAQPAAAK